MQWTEATIDLIRAARDEDLGDAGDITAGLLPEGNRSVSASVVSRAAGVICGLALGPVIVAEFAVKLGSRVRFDPLLRDGDSVAPGTIVAHLIGPLAGVLAIERTLLNFLCRMSGVASLTRSYVEAARRGDAGAAVLDTRKTLPGWRELDKYSVVAGGGTNHRIGLYDAVLIKDNHLAGVPIERLASRLFEMLNALPHHPRPAFVEVEVDSIAQLREVLKVVGIDFVLLDNFSLDQLRDAVALRDQAGLRGKLALEASGGVRLDTIAAIAATGVDRISVGAITHSAVALDLGLDL
ncbi:MAG: carboxylating nicotinate-nucleotide diphosphorylase [Phycisphaerae bacterium]